jgi:glutamate-1-semialdehyde 2,1-aminomutase
MAAGAAVLDALGEPGTYERLEAKSARLEAGLRGAAAAAGATVRINRVGSMITVFFCAGEVVDYASAKVSDTRRFARCSSTASTCRRRSSRRPSSRSPTRTPT